MAPLSFRAGWVAAGRQDVAFIEAGPEDGRLLVFLHGWPEIGLVWRRQIEHFAATGWRCVAPDLRGYGGSSVPDATGDYAVRASVADMLALHDALGGKPCVWVGHDWGCAVVWSLAAHHPDRCRAVANLCVPYFARGMTLDSVLPLVDRAIYPADRFPVGQWDYWLHHRHDFAASARALEADVRATLSLLYRRGTPAAVGQPAPLASVRSRGGWFGRAGRAPLLPRDEALMGDADFDVLVEAFERTGFSGANAWYLNDAPNAAYAAEAPRFGRLALPVLFVHARFDTVCDTVHSRLAEPMRADCANLTEAVIDAGHWLMMEQPAETNAAIEGWLSGLESGG